MIQDGLEYISDIFGRYFDNYGYVLLIGVVVFLLLTKYRTREGNKLLWICGIIVILFLNPVVIYLVCQLKGAVTGRYVRIFWLFPFIVGIAYVVTRLLKDKKIYQKVLITAFAAIILWGTGGTILSEKCFADTENLYKIPQEVIYVADKIEECKREEWEQPYVLSTVHLSTYLRQYDGNIRQVFGREPVVGDANHFLYQILYARASTGLSYDELYEVGIKARELGVNMIVLNKYQIQCTALETIGYELAGSTENYYIYSDVW